MKKSAPHRAIAWDDDTEFCADALYLKLAGKSLEEVMPVLTQEVIQRHEP